MLHIPFALPPLDFLTMAENLHDTVVPHDVSVPITNFPTRYSDFLDVFKKRNVDRLLAHRAYDSPVKLNDGAHPPFGSIYGLSEPEFEALQTYLDKNHSKGFRSGLQITVRASHLICQEGRLTTTVCRLSRS